MCLLLLGCGFFFLYLPLVIQCTADAWGWSGCMGVSSTCFICLAVAFELPSSWQVVHPACWELIKVHTAFIYCFRNKVLIFRKKKQTISSMKYLGCLWWVFGKIDWPRTTFNLRTYCIIPLIYTSCTLPEACQEIKVGLYFILPWDLLNSSKHSQIVSKLRSSLGRLQDTYWSMPKSPLQATTFLHFWHSGSAASSHSSMFLHLSLPFENL